MKPFVVAIMLLSLAVCVSVNAQEISILSQQDAHMKAFEFKRYKKMGVKRLLIYAIELLKERRCCCIVRREFLVEAEDSTINCGGIE